MLRVGILGKTDSARRKEEIVKTSESGVLMEAGDPRHLIEACDLVVLADADVASRAELASMSLRRGRHVFSDWPIADTAEATRRLWQTAEESGVQLATNRPDRLHRVVIDLRERAPTLLDVNLTAGKHYRFENLLTDAVDLCLYLSKGSGVHRYEAEATRDGSGMLTALFFALRFHSGSLALGRVAKTDEPPVRSVFGAANGWNSHVDLLLPSDGDPYDPSTDEASFRSCIECLATGQAVRTAVHDLEETVRAVGNIMSRTRNSR